MSGFMATAEGKQRAFALDAPLLLKPFTPQALAHEVRRILNGA